VLDHPVEPTQESRNTMTHTLTPEAFGDRVFVVLSGKDIATDAINAVETDAESNGSRLLVNGNWVAVTATVEEVHAILGWTD
jgi:hypothetical protein